MSPESFTVIRVKKRGSRYATNESPREAVPYGSYFLSDCMRGIEPTPLVRLPQFGKEATTRSAKLRRLLESR
jgi:hypothetical protein